MAKKIIAAITALALSFSVFLAVSVSAQELEVQPIGYCPPIEGVYFQ